MPFRAAVIDRAGKLKARILGISDKRDDAAEIARKALAIAKTEEPSGDWRINVREVGAAKAIGERAKRKASKKAKPKGRGGKREGAGRHGLEADGKGDSPILHTRVSSEMWVKVNAAVSEELPRPADVVRAALAKYFGIK